MENWELVWISKNWIRQPKKNPYLLPFFDEVLNTIVGYETYLFLDGYIGYHQIGTKQLLEQIGELLFGSWCHLVLKMGHQLSRE
jgi:hypothetical protein